MATSVRVDNPNVGSNYKPAGSSYQVGKKEGTYTTASGQKYTVKSGGKGSGGSRTPTTKTTSGEPIKEVSPGIYTTPTGQLVSGPSTQKVTVSRTAGQKDGAVIPQAPRAPGRYAVTNPYTQKNVELATQRNAREAFYAAGYQQPVQTAQLNLERQRGVVLTSERFTDQGIKGTIIPQKGTESRGEIKVYTKTVTAQNPTEARLAGLPSPGTYDVTYDKRRYDLRETVLVKAERAAAEKIKGTVIETASIKVESFGQDLIRRAEASTPSKNDFRNREARGQAGGKFIGGFVAQTGRDIRERPVELVAIAAGGAALKAVDTGVLAVRGSQALSGAGLAARTARRTITVGRTTTGTVLVGGFVASTGYQVIGTKGDAVKLGALGATTTEDLLAFGAGYKGAKAILEPPAKIPVSTPFINIRKVEPKVQVAGPSIQSVPPDIPTIKLVPLSEGKFSVIEGARGVNTPERLASAMSLGSKRVATSGGVFEPSPRISTTVVYEQNYPGWRGLFAKPEKVVVRTSPEGRVKTTVTKSPDLKIVTVQEAGSTTATTRKLKLGEPKEKLFTVKETGPPSESLFKFNIKRPSLRWLTSKPKVGKPLEAPVVTGESLVGKPVSVEAKNPQTGTVVQTIKGVEESRVSIDIGGKQFAGVGKRSVAIKEMAVASDAARVKTGNLLVVPERGSVAVAERRSMADTVKTGLSVGESAARRNEYAVSYNPKMTVEDAVIDTPSLRTLAKEGKLLQTTAEIGRTGGVGIKTPQKSTTFSRDLSLTRRGKETFKGYLEPVAAKEAAPEPSFTIKEPKPQGKKAKQDYAALTKKLAGQRQQMIAESKAEVKAEDLKVQEAALSRLVKTQTPKPRAKPSKERAVFKAPASQESRSATGDSLTLPVQPRATGGKGKASPLDRAREDTGIIQDTGLGNELKVGLPQASRSGSRTRTSFRQESATGQLPALGVSSTQRIDQSLKEKQRQELKLTTLSRGSPRYKRSQFRGEQVKLTTGIVPPRPLSNSSKGGPFSLLVRRKGKFKTVRAGLSAEEAIKLGKEKTEGSLAASFKVVGAGGTALSIKEAAGSLGGRFRPAKKDSTTFVQKAAFRLSSLGEKREIRSARRNPLRGIL